MRVICDTCRYLLDDCYTDDLESCEHFESSEKKLKITRPTLALVLNVKRRAAMIGSNVGGSTLEKTSEEWTLERMTAVKLELNRLLWGQGAPSTATLGELEKASCDMLDIIEKLWKKSKGNDL